MTLKSICVKPHAGADCWRQKLRFKPQQGPSLVALRTFVILIWWLGSGRWQLAFRNYCTTLYITVLQFGAPRSSAWRQMSHFASHVTPLHLLYCWRKLLYWVSCSFPVQI